jgi:hypothetical protein
MNDAFSTALANAYNGEKTRGAFNKYSPPGTRVGGTIVSRDLFQATDPKTRQKKTWDDGNPIMKAVIVVQTDAREDADDDGQRGIYVNWYGDDLRNLKASIEQTGDSDLRIGGWFGAHFVREEPPAAPGLNGRKVYEYRYQPPAFIDQGQSQPQPAGNSAGPHFQAQPQPQPQVQTGPSPAGPQIQPQIQPQPVMNVYGQGSGGNPDNSWGPAQPQQSQPPAQPQPQFQPQPDPQLQFQPQPQPAGAPAWALQNQRAAAAQPQAAPQGSDDDSGIRALIGEGYLDEDIAAATGAPIAQIQHVRAQFQ